MVQQNAHIFSRLGHFWAVRGVSRAQNRPKCTHVAISGSVSSNLATNGGSWLDLQGDFLTGPALKVVSVGDGKIPTKKRESLSKNFPFLL